jgi:hypothetical protein
VRFWVVPAAASNQFNIDVEAATVAATRAFSAGDKLGAMVVGTWASIWHGVSGVWTCVLSTTATTTRAGAVVLGIRDQEGRIDDFRAGTL